MENYKLSKEPLLEVKNLRCYFNDKKLLFKKNKEVTKAVDDISFKINKGEVYGLVGESGCGKSTTGRAILSLVHKTSGTLKFDGNLIYDVENNYSITNKKMQSLRKDMQMIFQDPYSSLDPCMTVENIIKQGMLKHGLLKNKNKMNEVLHILKLCGLRNDCINKYPHEFSGGERQRIGIARALAINPKFLVCDEPTAALDVSIQAQIIMLMDKLKKEMGLTYLFISHNLSLVRYFCDRVGVMYLGKIVEECDAEKLFITPKHPYTKCLISSIPKTHPTEKKERIILKNELPSSSDTINGCKFHTRCPYVQQICKNSIPELKEIEPGHFVACHKIFN